MYVIWSTVFVVVWGISCCAGYSNTSPDFQFDKDDVVDVKVSVLQESISFEIDQKY